MPEQVLLRIPHPEGNRAVKVTGGYYDNASETVMVKLFTGKSIIRIEY
jgi:hypothetical protein